MAPGKDRQSEDNAKDAVSAAGATTPGFSISHERPAPETEPHVIAPLIVALPDGRRLTARKWSLSGIRDEILSAEDLTGARLMIPFQGIEVGFPVRLAPSADGSVWAFEGLTGRQREALGLFYRNLISGKMAATDEIITALDTPVDLIPMGETEEEEASGKARMKPRPLRIVWNIVYYVALFAVVVGYLGSFAWERLDHVALSNARYMAPILEIAAPANGFVAGVIVPEGTPVPAGAELMRLSDPETDSGLAEVRSQLAQAKDRLADVDARLAAHKAQRPVARRAATDPSAFDAGISVTPGDYHDTRLRLEQERRLVELELRAVRADRARLDERNRALVIHAPETGTVSHIMVQGGSYQRVGAPLLVFETDAPRQVLGWLDASEAAHVWQGMRATVRYSVAGETHSAPATVTTIEAGTDPLRPDAYGLLVRLDLQGLTLAETRTLLPHNAAVEVRLHRDLARRWFGIGD
ncbi:HlyD family secretion protein [Ciceribacter sp. RN22]|uniref:HlyD family secretion protein n=1 Tax=Ciceribacter sp. RN22 TaxID=2954932 RepID=UPI002092EAB2|nr:HlyD family efflux transporter periplasmic adaptor subunit [Ciceribacter sp. RN22]MCO6177023.1 HlyD family secretion protein [Ciceribacter sp. RN22]